MLIKEFSFLDAKQTGRQWLALMLLLIAGTASLMARELESVDQIYNEIQDYMVRHFDRDANTEYEIGQLDQRLKLDKCTVPLEIFKPVGAKNIGYSSLGIRCDGAKKWKIHVPIKIIRFENVLTAKQTLTRGHTISAHDVQSIRMDISRLSNGYYSQGGEIDGMLLTRSARRGEVITGGMLEVPKMVKRGEMITILADTGNLVVRVKGEALMDGHKDDIIRVKNYSSNKEIQARVVSAGLVMISM